MNKGEFLEGSESLWRRIHPNHLRDGRLTSAAFSGVEMSVDIARIQQDMSITLGGDAGVAGFKAAVAQELNQRTVADPLLDNPAHALVIGSKSKSVKRNLREAAGGWRLATASQQRSRFDSTACIAPPTPSAKPATGSP